LGNRVQSIKSLFLRPNIIPLQATRRISLDSCNENLPKESILQKYGLASASTPPMSLGRVNSGGGAIGCAHRSRRKHNQDRGMLGIIPNLASVSAIIVRTVAVARLADRADR
jgi:hypothetical protein